MGILSTLHTLKYIYYAQKELDHCGIFSEIYHFLNTVTYDL